MISVLALFFVVLYIIRALAWRFLHLRSVPGPRWAAYGRLWMIKTLASGDSATRYVEVNKHYGMYSVILALAC